MIAFLRGKVAAIESDALVLDVQGVGYRVYIPTSLINQLPDANTEILLHTFLVVREDNMQLYGFLSQEEIAVFNLLIGVNGVGPKLAMAVLSCFTPQGFSLAVVQENMSALTKVPGVGKKTAQRMMLELKDKLKQLDLHNNLSLVDQGSASVAHGQQDAVEALMALGYSVGEARLAVSEAMSAGATDVAASVQSALRLLDKAKK